MGPINTWLERLRAVDDLVLDAHHPAYVAWHPDLTTIYDDFYAQILGEAWSRNVTLGRRVYDDFFAEIVRRHGGRNWVTSGRGHGATFCFYPPIAPGASGVPNAALRTGSE